MINKKYYCNICDKNISTKSSHKKTKLDIQLSLSVVNKYYINDISVKEIDNIINNIFMITRIFFINLIVGV